MLLCRKLSFRRRKRNRYYAGWTKAVKKLLKNQKVIFFLSVRREKKFFACRQHISQTRHRVILDCDVNEMTYFGELLNWFFFFTFLFFKFQIRNFSGSNDFAASRWKLAKYLYSRWILSSGFDQNITWQNHHFIDCNLCVISFYSKAIRRTMEKRVWIRTRSPKNQICQYRRRFGSVYYI